MLTPQAGHCPMPDRLTVRTWIGADLHGYAISFALLAHPPTARLTPARSRVDRQMRAFTASIGLRPPDQPIADLGSCVTVHSGTVRLYLQGVGKQLTLPADERWVRMLLPRPEVAVVVGLAPLAINATDVEVDRYLGSGLQTGHLLLGRARVTDSRRPPRRPTLGQGLVAAFHPTVERKR